MLKLKNHIHNIYLMVKMKQEKLQLKDKIAKLKED